MNVFFKFKKLSCLLILALSLGCAAGDGDSSDDGGGGGGNDGGGNGSNAVTSKTTVTADSNGSAPLNFSLPSGTTKFSIVAQTSANSLRFEALRDSDNNNFLTPNGSEVSFATTFLNDLNVASAPSRSQDPSINTDNTFSAVTSSSSDDNGNNPASDAVVNFTVTSREDGNFGGGTLDVNIFFVGSVGQNPTNKNAITSAVEEFKRIYAKAGISLRINNLDVSGANILPDPLSGSEFYRNASALGIIPGLFVFVTGDVSGTGDRVLGIAGGIPGPAISTTRSAVVISIANGAGANGVFDSEEIRVLGETLAHESGHYLGLFHPVDFDGNTVAAEDPLSDTATCSSINQCLQNDSLIGNLMYASPVQDTDGSLIPQNNLTSQQGGVMNRYIAVD